MINQFKQIWNVYKLQARLWYRCRNSLNADLKHKWNQFIVIDISGLNYIHTNEWTSFNYAKQFTIQFIIQIQTKATDEMILGEMWGKVWQDILLIMWTVKKGIQGYDHTL